MPNLLSATGLQTSTRAELVTFFTENYQNIYGADINLSSDTPDGQMMNIFIQMILDLEDLLVQIYNTFDPDNAIGVILDQRVAINGIQRQAGTFTVTSITLVNSQSVNLYGIDQDTQEIYTISDNAGNLWVLQTTQLGLSAGTHVLTFQAAEPGAQLTIPNTITSPVTIVLGVTSVNNPTTYTTLGINEESDANLKVRRQKSVSLASQGYLAGLLAALENINGVTSAFVYENTTSEVNEDFVPGHSIWVIVAGTAAPSAIAQAIYTKRNAGCGMYGNETYVVTQVDGSPFTVYWDTVVTRNLFIKFFATSINNLTLPNLATIRPGVAAGFVPGVNAEVNVNGLATLVQQIDPNTLVTYGTGNEAGFSTGEDQSIVFLGPPASGTFKVKYNGATSAFINWNDSIGTIESKVQAVSGLSGCGVTGSLVSGELVFDLGPVPDGPQGFITVVDNTLETSAPAAVTISYVADFFPTLETPSKQNQFVVAEENVIILAMQLSPFSSQVASGGAAVQFRAYGGYGDYVYSILTNNSGASINASTGLYNSGATPSVVDVIKATDVFGNIATASVTVS